jgi:hypothetical protein
MSAGALTVAGLVPDSDVAVRGMATTSKLTMAGLFLLWRMPLVGRYWHCRA